MIGTEDGLVLLCSTNQTTIVGPNQWIDPVINELQSHQFAVRSLHYYRIQNPLRMVLVSCDVSGEIFIRQQVEVNNNILLNYSYNSFTI